MENTKEIEKLEDNLVKKYKRLSPSDFRWTLSLIISKALDEGHRAEKERIGQVILDIISN